ncbi:MAG: Glu/Leu/Phe/Val family dehydrogenase [Gammaproteobacteria bacterium]
MVQATGVEAGGGVTQEFPFADDLGPHKVIHVYEPGSGLRGVLVIDNVAAGPSIGGLRMASDVSTSECFRLARAMTMKNAAAGLAHGGGKSVIWGDPGMPPERKETLVRAFASALAHETGYIFGPDMGTNEQCMAWVKDEIGRAVGLPAAIGGIPLDEYGATGFGLLAAARVAQAYCDVELDGARVVVQGFGSVGRHAARFLAEAGAVLVGAADSHGALVHPDGLDIDALIALKAEGGRLADHGAGEQLPRDAVIGVDCDIWIPAARPDVVDVSNVEQLNTRLILQGANIPITLAAEAQLHERGILNIPDFIANAGGVICAAMEYAGAGRSAAFQAIEDKVATNTREVLERTVGSGVLPREAAVAMAGERVRAAMTTRRWSVF